MLGLLEFTFQWQHLLANLDILFINIYNFMKPDCNCYRHDLGSDLNSVTDGAVDLEL